MLHLRALRHRARPDPGPAHAGADDHADALAEAYVAPDARADDARADARGKHRRRAAAARGRARRRGCCLRRLSPYLITRRPPPRLVPSSPSRPRH